MKEIKKCTLCKSMQLEKIKDYTFKNPGNNVLNHQYDSKYERLWILFEKIIANHNDYTFNCMMCIKCGFIFLNPRLTENEIKIKYDMINELDSVKYRLKKKSSFNLEKRANRIFSLTNKFYKKNSNIKLKILDYGGASGYILHPFINEFQCFILDYQKWDLKEGISYLGNDIFDLKASDKFDIILLLHTLEHVINPKEFLTNLLNHLNDNGIIYIEVPLGCFYEWRHLEDPITHINFFSEESLFKFAKLCNLNIVYLKTSLQWVVQGKNLCINIIGTKNKVKDCIKIKDLKPTHILLSKFYFYQYYYYFLAIKSILMRIKINTINTSLKIFKDSILRRRTYKKYF